MAAWTQEAQTAASEQEPESPAADKEMPPELKAKLTSLCDSFRNLGFADHLSRLEELCAFMDKRQLPFSAQLFVLDQHVYSLDETVAKSQALVRAAKAGTRLDFSVQCLEDFVESCKECHDAYDYPADTASTEGDLQVAAAAAAEGKAATKDSTVSGESASSSQRFTNSIDNNNSSSNSKRMSACTDPGYFSNGNAHPVPKPRRGSAVSEQSSTSLCSARESSQTTAGYKTPQHQEMSRRKVSTSSGGAGSNSGVRKSGSFLQMLLYPEVTKREAAVKKKKKVVAPDFQAKT